jgi:alpha-1,4-N-acetylglucosaminyltransferase EXTL3
MPFKLFPSTPNDPFVPTNVKYALKPDTKMSSIFKGIPNITEEVYGGSDFVNFLYKGLGGNYDDEQFTIIILTYKREKVLSVIMDKYFTVPHLHKMIVVWNDLEVKPSDAFLFKYKEKVDNNRLVFIQSYKNNIDNRFFPYDHIETDCVLITDDDVPLRKDELIFGFRTWRENRHRLVGFTTRFHSWDIKNQKTIYKTHRPCEFSFILTNFVFFHKFYSYVYTHLIDPRLRALVERTRNCDDLAFNYMIAAYTRQPPIKISHQVSLDCHLCDEFNEYPGMSVNGSHYDIRNDCLNEMNQIYGYNPLLYSQTRIDSPLFKISNYKMDKCYRYI